MNFIMDHSDRWKTAVILLAVIAIVGIIDNHFLTWIFFGAVYIMAFDEAWKLFGGKELKSFAYAGAIWLLAGLYPHASDIVFLALVVFGAVLAYLPDSEPKEFLPIIYPTAGMLFVWMLYLEHGMGSLFWMLLIVAFTDVGAFYVGKSIGQNQFSPTSPNKTIEGVIGGITLGTIAGAIAGASLIDISIFASFVISLFASISSVFGDLFESYLKRQAGVKDSGTILPGHGGVLDRIDGYLFASILIYVLLQI